MKLVNISPEQLAVRSHDLFHFQNLLLTCGDHEKGHFNTMTIAWGSIGTMWSKPCVWVFVRPSRYTFEFMNTYSDFTVTAFPRKYHAALSYLGSHSGRDSNKILEAGLTPIAATLVASPAFTEAELIIECKKIYFQDLDPEKFLDQTIFRSYPNPDYHRMYIGEIVSILGDEKFLQEKTEQADEL